ncbi:MAG: tryptophan--tRNA ligase [Candidatus Yanofskybacteria bacterium]|nr:tryptophan--tRNA ligase [Candidatus Yanofskybacteria bacterium]
MADRIFSGIRPSGKLHLGNYLGAIKNWIELQNSPDTERAIFAVVDYHGITTPFDPETYRQQTLDTVLDFLAIGIDPKKSLLIRQSHIPEHTELAWIFNTITPVSWLERLPTYKEKLEESGKKYNHVGLLDYPVLMAADILIYKSNLVPIGDDQKAHIDITNEIAKKFNHMFGETFEPVKAYKAEGERIKSLQDSAKKMSKSGDEGIALIDFPDVIREKIKKAVTDSGHEVIFDPDKKPAISNLITIYHLLIKEVQPREPKEVEPLKFGIREIEKKYSGKTYIEFKNDLAEIIVNFLKPFQEKRKELEQDMTYVEDVLTESEEKAKLIASSTLTEIKQKMGL